MIQPIGSLAAGWMSSAGAIEAGSAFAVLQSAAMGGYGVPIVAGAVQGVAAGAGVIHCLVKPSAYRVDLTVPGPHTIVVAVVDYFH